MASLLTALPWSAVAAADPGPLPEQVGGSADGKSHRASGASTEEKRRPDRFDRGGPPAKGVPADRGLTEPKLTVPDAAETTMSVDRGEAPGKVKGFDPATSRELPDRGGPKRQVFENADGTVTARHFQSRQMFRAGDGSWHKIDSTLVDAEGGWRSKADSEPKVFAASASARELASVELESGESFGFGVSQAAASAGTARGDSVIYRAVRPDADLELQATPVGVKETIVLRSADAPTEWQFPLRMEGLTARLDEHGTVLLTNDQGDVAAVIPPGFMEDSNIDKHSGNGVRSNNVSYRLSGEPGSQVLHVSADQEWLAAPGRKFPVRVDPTMQRDSNASTYVMSPYTNDYSGESTISVGTFNGGTNKANAFLKFNSVTSDLDNFKILNAKLGLYNVWSYSCSAREVSVNPVAESWSTSAPKSWPGPSVHSEIGSKSFASGRDGCGSKWHLIDLGAVGDAGINRIQSWVRGGPNNGLRVSASTTDTYGWKKFASANSANAPYLDIVYSKWWAEYTVPTSFLKHPTATADGTMRVTVKNDGKYTWTPTSGYKLSYRLWDLASNKELLYPAVARTAMTKNVATGQSITLDAVVKKLEPGDYRLRWDMLVEGEGGARFSSVGVPYSVAVDFEIPNQYAYVTSMSPLSGFQSATLQPTLKVTGKDPDNYPNTGLKYQFKVCDDAGANCFTSTSGTATSWTVPAGKLSWSKTYLWSARVADGTGAWGGFSGSAALTPVVAQPAITSHLGGKAGGGVDPGVGNFTTSVTDAAVAVVGPELAVKRTYNSQEPREDLVFGSGWATRWDARLVPDDDASGNVVVTYPDGRQARFGKNHDGTYSAPQGQQATLVAVTGGGWTLRSPGDIAYTFDADGRLVKITDTIGRTQTLTYTDGHLTKATDEASGRSLSFAWQNGHVASVTTGPTPALTWNYTYTGDQLTKVCDPEGGCTNYSYQAGSVYRTVVMDANPSGYWRLADAADGTVASDVPNVNDNLNGTSVDVADDANGPIAQTTLPAAKFNGTSSYVKVAENPLKDDKYMSVELWFKTTGSAGGVLFSTGNFTPGGTVGTSGSMPVLYVGTDGKLYGHFSNGNITGIVTPTAVNDGAWHHVVLSAALDTQTLYLDGAKVGTQTGAVSANYTHAYFGAGVVTTQPWTARPASQWGYLNGGIAEASIYRRPIGAITAAEHYAARQATSQLATITRPGGAVQDRVSYNTATERVSEHTDSNGAVWKYGSPTTEQTTGDGDQTIWRTKIAVTDPIQEQTIYAFDPTRSGRLVEVVDPDDRGGRKRTYEYDQGGFLRTITDPLEHSIELRYDTRGNLISRTVPYWDDIAHTEYWSYFVNPADPLDPRNDQVTYHRNARSTSATDDTYLTRYIHNGDGQVESIVAPGATGGMQHTTTNVFTNGTEAAVGGGTMPPGLLRRVTDPEGGITGYSYTSAGDIASITDAVGQRLEHGYDGIGRRTSDTVVLPDGSNATTTQAYDGASRVTQIRQPAVTNAVTDAEQQLQAVHSYNADGTVASSTVSDTKQAGSERTTSYGYDSLGRMNKITDAEGGIEQLEYNQFGQVYKRTDPAGTSFTHSYVPTHTGWQLAETTVHGWTGDGGEARDVVLESRAYDPAGRVAHKTDAMGTITAYSYWHNNRLATTGLANYEDPDTQAVGWRLQVHHGYTGTGNVFGEVRTDVGPQNRTDYTFDPADRVTKEVVKHGDATLRTVESSYNKLGNPTDVSQKHADGSLAAHDEYAYDAMGRETRHTQHVTSTTTAVTSTVRDTRGLPTSIIDPRGNATGANPDDYTTTNAYDALGRLTTVTAPPVQVESNGGAAETKRPVTTTGYNAFDEITHERDPNGNITRTVQDRVGRTVSETLPDYTAPGATSPTVATTARTYDPAGRLTTETDPVGEKTTYGYDELGNLRMTVDPSVSLGSPGGTTLISYTPTGLPRATTDPSGAQTSTTYDRLGQPITSTVHERKPTAKNLTTKFRYDLLGNQTKVISPSGLVTATEYDGLGNPTKITDPAGVVTTTVVDSLGQVRRITHPETAVRKFEYDLAGHNTSVRDESSAGTVLREQSSGYDLAGNQTSTGNSAGQNTEHTFDAIDRLTRIKRLKGGTSEWITTSYGYDAVGNVTRATDGNGNKTVYTVNTWNLPESTIEPTTSQHPSVAERTYKLTYAKTGQVASLTKPGNVTITNTYDPLGNLIKKDGSGAVIGTPDPTFDYDLTGRLTRATVPAGANTFSYDDRGNLLSASGLSGTTEQVWDDDGRLASATTGAGTAQFGYNSAGRLTTATDPATGSTVTYQYDAAGRVDSVGPAGGATREFGYDTFGRLHTDTITKPDGTTAAKLTYGYNDADELTSKTSTGIAGAAAHTYGYDKAGRLTSWNNGSAAVSYVWDDAGNLTKRGQTTQAFNARNQLISSGNTSYGYSSRGSLKTATTDGVTKNYQFDAFEQLGSSDGTANTYDALNRLVRAGDTTLAYFGTSRTVAAAGPWSYTHTPDGNPLGATNGATTGLTWADAHTDLIGLVDPATGVLAGSRSYDPFGLSIGTAGVQPSVGYQHQYTDPASGAVNMGSRWYTPDTGTFSSRDTIGLDPRDTLNANRYGYAASSPLSHIDPNGTCVNLRICAGPGGRVDVPSMRGSVARNQTRGTRHALSPRPLMPRGRPTSRYNRDVFSPRMNLSRINGRYNARFNRGPANVRPGNVGRGSARPGSFGRGGPGFRGNPGARGGVRSTQQTRIRMVQQRANTRAPRPSSYPKGITSTQKLMIATKVAWNAANNLDNAINIGIVGGDDKRDSYQPDQVDPGPLPPAQAHLDDTCHYGGGASQNGSASSQVWTCGSAAADPGDPTANLPLQLHHFATNKSKKYTPAMEALAGRYGLDLDDDWNTGMLPHQGRHPNAYHEWVLEQMMRASRDAGHDGEKFKRYFDEYVKQPVRKNPIMLRRDGWP